MALIDGPGQGSSCANCGADLSVTRMAACCAAPVPSAEALREIEIDTYLRGECHVHAIASVRLHGGGFAVAYDRSGAYADDEDDPENDVPSVIHVWSLHETPGGLIARDVTGDMAATPERMRAALLEHFPDLWERFADGDIEIDTAATLEEIRALSGDDDDLHPLCFIDEGQIEAASRVPSVMAEPGTNPAPAPTETPTFSLP